MKLRIWDEVSNEQLQAFINEIKGSDLLPGLYEYGAHYVYKSGDGGNFVSLARIVADFTKALGTKRSFVVMPTANNYFTVHVGFYDGSDKLTNETWITVRKSTIEKVFPELNLDE
ncbi:hypothetical protein ACFBZI_10995 [Moraxella sp. ZJ142]|uniref:hypothetical protein n=1 Tax=Moraxella marmotae TaxID=3344520 RepID=UPI0035D4C023